MSLTLSKRNNDIIWKLQSALLHWVHLDAATFLWKLLSCAWGQNSFIVILLPFSFCIVCLIPGSITSMNTRDLHPPSGQFSGQALLLIVKRVIFLGCDAQKKKNVSSNFFCCVSSWEIVFLGSQWITWRCKYTVCPLCQIGFRGLNSSWGLTVYYWEGGINFLEFAPVS